MFQRFLKSTIGEIIQIALISLAIVIPLRLYVAQPFVVSGPSMDDTFANGQYLIVDELSYHFRDPSRGEVIIFKYPLDTSKFFIKRVIGLPGETVEIHNSEIKIKNKEYPEGFIITETYTKIPDKTRPPRIDDLSIVLDPDQYFVLGDNRYVSLDSRVWGTLDRDLIIGRPFVRLFPLSKIDFLPGFVKI